MHAAIAAGRGVRARARDNDDELTAQREQRGEKRLDGLINDATAKRRKARRSSLPPPPSLSPSSKISPSGLVTGFLSLPLCARFEGSLPETNICPRDRSKKRRE